MIEFRVRIMHILVHCGQKYHFAEEIIFVPVQELGTVQFYNSPETLSVQELGTVQFFNSPETLSVRYKNHGYSIQFYNSPETLSVQELGTVQF